MKLIISCLVVFIIFTFAVYSQKNISPNFYDIQKQSLQYFKSKKSTQKDDSWAKYKRWEWFWKQRVTPDGQFPNPMAVYNETVKKQAEQKKSGAQILSGVTANWKERGPFGPADGGGAGRVNRVHLNPFFPNDVWAGTAAGGAWKSTDKGLTWKIKTDGIPILGVTDIATVSSDPNIVYIATGDGDGDITNSNVQDHISYSLGVMKSTDGGTTWTITGLNWQTSNARLISRLVVSPTNPQLLLAATSQGIYKTINGGTTWTITQNGYFMDMEFKPNDASNLYACSGSSIYKSVNEGSTWTKLSTGIPTSIGRIALGVGSANPEMVYALCSSQSNWGFGGFYSSTNAGQTWQLKSSAPNILGLQSDGLDPATEQFQGWYDLAIAISPSSSQEIYIGGINIWKTTNGGLSWFCNAHWYGDKGLPYVHADIHDLVISEENPSMIYSGNDGGVFRTSDNGKTWNDLSNGMGIMQFYRIASASVSTDLIIGGAQDNGTNLLKNGKWSEVNDGDGMNCLIDPNNSNILYAGAQEGDISRSTDGGANFPSFINTDITNEPGSWVTPYVFDPTNSKILYAGFLNVWKYNPTTLKWSKISKLNGSPLNYLAVAPSDINYIYAGNEGELSYTSNGGTSWQGITAPQLGNISHLAVHPSSPRRLWLTMSSYTNKKVYESNDAGQTWVDISAGLPSIPINCIVYQNNSPDRLYVGTEAGVYYRDNDLNQWQQFNDGLPNVIISDLYINYTANKLLAGTYGRGAWEANLINCTSSATVSVTVTDGKTTLCDGDSVKLTASDGFSSYRWSNGASTQTIYAKDAGEYIVTITDSKGCPASSKPVIIAVSTKKIPTIKGDHTDSTACEGNPITLDIGFGFAEFSIKWSTGDTTRKIKVTQAGIYTVTATNTAGCVGSSTTFKVKQGIAPAKPTITMSGDSLVSSVASMYQWYVDGLPLVGATYRWLIPPSGTLGKKATVAAFNSGGCSTTSDEYIITVTTVEEQSDERVQFYPNPAGQTITLSATLETVAPLVIQISNTLGVNVQTLELTPESQQVVKNISLKELPIGVYIVTVKSGGKIWVRKITKE